MRPSVAEVRNDMGTDPREIGKSETSWVRKRMALKSKGEMSLLLQGWKEAYIYTQFDGQPSPSSDESTHLRITARARHQGLPLKSSLFYQSLCT